MSTPNHGTYSRYANYGCRCDACRIYQNQRVRASRAKRLAEGRISHGGAGWDDGCRCEVCASHHRDRGRAYRRRQMAMGWQNDA